MILEILLGVTIVMLILILVKWIQIYNTFQYLRQSVQEKLSNIEVYMKQRSDMILAIVQVAKKYNLHENTTFKETSEARSRWDTSAPLAERVQALSDMEDNYLKIQAVVENYPNLKAELLHSKILDNDVTIENQLALTRLDYNNIVREYNYQVKFFPISIVAHFHRFDLYPYFSVGNTPEYVPQKLYGD